MNVPQSLTSYKKTKQERLEARVSPDLKMRLQYAADLQGSSLSEFLLRSAEKAANEVINDNQIIKLTTEDSRKFVNALFNPPKPNSNLKKALKNYKRAVSSQA